MTILALAGWVRRAAHIVLLWGAFFALTPSCSLAAGTVTLAWDPSSGTNVIAGYKIYYGIASRTYTNVVSAGTATTLSVSNLVEGQTYYFAATAVDAFGLESDYSTEVSTVIPVGATNQPPTLNLLVSFSINENAALQTVNLSGISSGAANEVQTLTVTASSSNPSLIPTPTVNYASPNATGSISFTPVAYAFGSATITVTVNDGGPSNNVVSRSFAVIVNPVNQAPTLNTLANVTLNENAALQTVNLSGISSGAANEVQTLTVTASSSNPSLIPTPTVNYASPNATGSISFTPVAYAFGSATVTVTVNDGGASNNVVSRLFTVTVNQINQPPTISTIANQTITANTATPPLPFVIGDPDTAVSNLTVSASSSLPTLVPTKNIVFGGSGANRTVTLTPTPGQSGYADITLRVSDGSLVASTTFRLTVAAGKPPPTDITLEPISVVTPPDTYLCFRVGSSLVNKGQLAFSFDPNAPMNAQIDPTNGLFVWNVTRADAQTTNNFTVRIVDLNSRSRQVLQPMSVVVQAFLEVGLGAAAAQAGQNVSLPVTVDSSGGVTNLVFTVAWPAGRCANATLAVIAPEIASGTLQTQGTNWVVRVQTKAGQALNGSEQIAQLSFQTVAGQRSAFVPLVISSMAATDTSGVPYPNYIPRNGKVVIVGDAPLLSGAQSSGLSRTLTLYGKVGLTHELLCSTNGFSAAAWQPVLSYLQTNVAQQVVVTSPSPVVFYRLVAR